MPGGTAGETRVGIEFKHGSQQQLFKSRRETGI